MSLSWVLTSSDDPSRQAVPLTCQAVNGSTPVYLSSYFTRVTDVPSRLRLRSSTSDQLIVPSYNLTTVSRQAFPVSATNFWNGLPANLTSAHRQRLKTFLFRRSCPDLIIWHFELSFWYGPNSNQCCCPRGKSLSSRTNFQVHVLGRGRTIIGSVSNRGRYLSIGIGSDRGLKYLANHERQWGDAVITRLCALISVSLTTVATARQSAGSGEVGGGEKWYTPDWTECRPLKEKWGREAPDGWVSCSSRRSSPMSWQTLLLLVRLWPLK